MAISHTQIEALRTRRETARTNAASAKTDRDIAYAARQAAQTAFEAAETQLATDQTAFEAAETALAANPGDAALTTARDNARAARDAAKTAYDAAEQNLENAEIDLESKESDFQNAHQADVAAETAWRQAIQRSRKDLWWTIAAALLIGGLALALGLWNHFHGGANGADGTDGVDGIDGVNGTNGVACWDLNSNGQPDEDEDLNRDGSVDVHDCQGPRGPHGPTLDCNLHGQSCDDGYVCLTNGQCAPERSEDDDDDTTRRIIIPQPAAISWDQVPDDLREYWGSYQETHFGTTGVITCVSCATAYGDAHDVCSADRRACSQARRYVEALRAENADEAERALARARRSRDRNR